MNKFNKKIILLSSLLISSTNIFGAAKITDVSIEKLNNRLFNATKNNRVESVKTLLDSKADVNAKNGTNETPLHYAASFNSFETAQLLLANKANVNAANANSVTPLHIAAKYNHVKIIILLLNNQASINVKNKHCGTPIDTAAIYNSIESVRVLLDSTKKTPNLFNPLLIAVKKNNGILVKLLIESNANIETIDSDGATLLHNAVESNSFEAAHMLLLLGANVDAINTNGYTPLHVAAEINKANIAKLLLDNKANINAQTYKANTPLNIALAKDSLNCALLLIEKNCDVNLSNNDLYTALHIAAEKNNPKITKLLIDSGADINAKTLHGFTPLHFAAEFNSLETLRMLLKNGAPVDSKDNCSTTPLYIACRKNLIDIARELIRNKADRKLLTNKQTYESIAISQGNLDLAKYLETQENAQNYKNSIFATCFGLQMGDFELIAVSWPELKKLMTKSTVAVKTDWHKCNLLHILFLEKAPDTTLIVRLISVNPDLLFMPNRCGHTPLDIAFKEKNPILLQIIFKLAFGDPYKPTANNSAITSTASSKDSASSASSSIDIISLLLNANEKIDKTSDAYVDDVATQAAKKNRIEHNKK